MDLLHRRDGYCKFPLAYELQHIRCDQDIHCSGEYAAQGSHSPPQKLRIALADAELNAIAVPNTDCLAAVCCVPDPDSNSVPLAISNSVAIAVAHTFTFCHAVGFGYSKPCQYGQSNEYYKPITFAEQNTNAEQ